MVKIKIALNLLYRLNKLRYLNKKNDALTQSIQFNFKNIKLN
jgi:hypothetical protein